MTPPPLQPLEDGEIDALLAELDGLERDATPGPWASGEEGVDIVRPNRRRLRGDALVRLSAATIRPPAAGRVDSTTGEERMKPTMTIAFPQFSGLRCLMMPYIQGDSASVPAQYLAYRDIIDSVFVKRGDIGFLTIDESPAAVGKPHRGARARYGRALHTEAGWRDDYVWGGGGWGSDEHVRLAWDTRVLLANNLDDTCALWDAEHPNTSRDGDIGDAADQYPYESAVFLKAGEVYDIGILTPHESLPVPRDCNRQFLRIVGSGVRGREPYFTVNPLFSPLPEGKAG